MQLLAFSSSKVGNSGYLEAAAPIIKTFLAGKPLHIAFLPFASADNDYEQYAANVRNGLSGLPHKITLALPENAKKVINQSDVVMVGGGNTFKLLHDLYAFDLLPTIREKVIAGAPYIGWSAGSNITGLTIGTTNDMPIIEPVSFKALGLLPFQINPHYINLVNTGHNGETRDQRLTEFIKINPSVPVVGLPEGTALQLNGNTLKFIGESEGVLFTATEKDNKIIKNQVKTGADLSFLLKKD